jgi:amidase
MATFITRLDPPPGDGPRLAVKDLIDVEGVPTTAGCAAVADEAKPAAADAPCLAGARAAGARIVGKANLYELAFGTSGINEWFGTPTNPLDAALVPGGSSSGSAVAVGAGDADVAYGSDTGGSVRIPSACCGTVGLKTTHGRVSLDGVWPLSLSLDTVGPMARDVAGALLGMQLLEPGFTAALGAATAIGRLRADTDAGVDPAIDAAVDAALAAAGFEVVAVNLPAMSAANRANVTILVAEAWDADRHLLQRRDRVSAEVATRIEAGSLMTAEMVADARKQQEAWQAELRALFDRVQVLALPTLPAFPGTVADDHHPATTFTGPFNLAGVPALSLPVPAGRTLPASLQLVGPHHSEDLLLATGAIVEAAVA